jgi:hypothetical protein
VPQLGAEVRSANTDGIVVRFRRKDEALVIQAVKDWEATTGYNMERTDYTLIASRDVSNYFALKPDGKVKVKGKFAAAALGDKNPSFQISYTAAIHYILYGAPILTTIESCQDLGSFVNVCKVTGGAMTASGEPLGNVVRFYYSTGVDKADNFHYAKSGNRVPLSNGARACIEMPDRLPEDIDYARYAKMAEEVVGQVGYDPDGWLA